MNLYPRKKFFPIKKKLIYLFLAFFLLVIIISIYIALAYKLSGILSQQILVQNQHLEKVSNRLHKLLFFMDDYLSNNNTENYANLHKKYYELKNILAENNFQQNYPELYLIIETLLNKIQNTVKTKENIYQDYSLLCKDINLTQKYINKLINQNNSLGNYKYSLCQDQIEKIEKKALFLFFFTSLLYILLGLYFTTGITKPLQKIMKNAQEISKGNFTVKPIVVKSNDELKTIATVFNQMTKDIEKSFADIKEKTKLKSELQQKELENLKINTLLREAKIKRLQAQINPHFLYNTLNTISQVAILEEADQTGYLIKKIAQLFRYNLNKANTLIPIKEELEIIKTYCYIMKIRYGNNVRVVLNYPDNIGNYYIPSMILQPLIENAFIHGISNLREKTGLIKIVFKKNYQNLIIKVIDNGKGLDKNALEEILNSTDDTISGLKNIRNRLKLIYKKDNLLTFKSKLDFFTEIQITIPNLEEVKTDV